MGGSPGTCPPTIEKRHQLVTPFVHPYFGLLPKTIFHKSTPIIMTKCNVMKSNILCGVMGCYLTHVMRFYVILSDEVWSDIKCDMTCNAIT